MLAQKLGVFVKGKSKTLRGYAAPFDNADLRPNIKAIAIEIGYV